MTDCAPKRALNCSAATSPRPLNAITNIYKPGAMQTAVVLTCAAAAILLQVLPASAHVRLTFPPARSPNYDFLDNVRTGGPCGVPREFCNDTVITWCMLLHCCCMHEYIFLSSFCFAQLLMVLLRLASWLDLHSTSLSTWLIRTG